MSLLSILKPKGKTGFGSSSTAEDVSQGIDLKGKTYLLTGSNSGIGKETLRVLCLRGAKVVALARTKEKALEVIKEVGNAESVGIACELSDPKSISDAILEIQKGKWQFDGIIANAGIMALPKLEKGHGYELQFFTNHIGHFYLVTRILGQLKDDGRVVILSSSAHSMAPKATIEFDNLDGSKSYTAWKAYGQSKMANLLFAKELHKRFQGTKKTAFAVHPGVISTNLGRHMPKIASVVFALIEPLFLKSIPEGAATQVFCAVHPKALEFSGCFMADSNPKSPRSDAENMETAKKLWDVSEEILKKIGV